MRRGEIVTLEYPMWGIQDPASSRAARRNKNVNEGNVLLGHNSIVPLCFNGTLGIIKNLYPIIIIRYNIRNFQTSVLYEKLLEDLIFIYLDLIWDESSFLDKYPNISPDRISIEWPEEPPGRVSCHWGGSHLDTGHNWNFQTLNQSQRRGKSKRNVNMKLWGRRGK